MQKATIGVDPGASGGLAVITDKAAWAYCFAETPVGLCLAQEVGSLEANGFTVQVIVENVHAFTGQGVSSSFKFGSAYGQVIGALDALKASYRLVQPQAWQKGIVGLTKKKDGATEHKRGLKIEAQRRFPQCKPTLKTCDALLIADYGRQTFK